VVLETNTRLRAAVALYEKAGFRVLRRVCIPPRCDTVYGMRLKARKG
jgi:ribosomal protein S18 acetylase RimI-like enzyme